MHTVSALRFTLLISAFILHPSSFILAQGSLTPPGAPAPTMKTLDQVEARTPIGSAPFTISASGSYYLTGNLTVATGNAIVISADDVTLDLNGFTIASTASAAVGSGVFINGVRRNVAVRNGTVRGGTTVSGSTFTTAGFLDGVNAPQTGCTGLRASDLQVRGIGDDGIVLGAGAGVATNVVERCSVEICGGFGIAAHTVRQSDARLCGDTGIGANTVSHCSGDSVGVSEPGISATALVESSRGTAISGRGIECPTGLVRDSTGSSDSEVGIIAASAMHCFGASTSGTAGLFVTGTASYCRGRLNGGTAISAGVAIGCTVEGTGTVSSPSKHLGTP